MTKIRKCVKDLVANIYYKLYRVGIVRLTHRIDVASIDETIDMLLNTHNSFVRFGDGELTIIRGLSIWFQKYREDMADRLKEIIMFQEEGLVVGLLDVFSDLDLYVPETAGFMKDHFRTYYRYYSELTNPDRKYYNALFSRCYIMLRDKSGSGDCFARIRDIWKDKEVVVVEGESTMNGVFDDLLDRGASVERVICPSSDAFDHYDTILEKCICYSHDRLFLLSLGPTAKPLALDLYRRGYRVIDIGNLGTEYQYYLHGVTNKITDPQTLQDPESDRYKACMKKYREQIAFKIPGT